MNRKRKTQILLKEYVVKIGNLPFRTRDGEKRLVEDTYICPLCLRPFDINKIRDRISEHLSLEDIPQKALGGNPLLLTCKECNNRCGHEIDHYLQSEIDDEDEISIHSENGVPGILETSEYKINTRIRKEEDGTITFNILSGQNHPIELEKFKEEVAALGDDWKKGVKAYHLIGNRHNPIKSDIAILKSAYLLAFYVLGYRYILTDSLCTIREQILTPDNIIVSNFILNRGKEIPDKCSDGVYVAEIKNKRFLAVIISLKIKGSEKMHRFVVALPYINSEYNIYDVIREDKEKTFSLLGFATIKDWSVKPFVHWLQKKPRQKFTKPMPR